LNLEIARLRFRVVNLSRILDETKPGKKMKKKEREGKSNLFD